MGEDKISISDKKQVHVEFNQEFDDVDLLSDAEKQALEADIDEGDGPAPDEDGDDTKVSFSAAEFLLALDGNLPKIVTVSGGNYSSTEWETAVQNALDAQFLPAGTVTATVDTTDLDNVTLTLSANNSLEIADTDTLSLTMEATNAITAAEIDALDLAVPDQRSRLFDSTTDTDNDVFSITMNLDVRAGVDFTPSGSPQLQLIH